jgi:hypothetical protein
MAAEPLTLLGEPPLATGSRCGTLIVEEPIPKVGILTREGCIRGDKDWD